MLRDLENSMLLINRAAHEHSVLATLYLSENRHDSM